VPSSWQRVPSSIRDLCTHIARLTQNRFPSSSPLQASGGYIFLRLLNPTIINPESVDLDLPTDNIAQIRKSLIHVTKILQSLSNSIKVCLLAYAKQG
jgi:neurofibromin 1